MAQTHSTVSNLRIWQYRQGLILFVFLFAYVGVEALFNLNRPYWGDEEHFAATVRQFGKELTVETIRHYEEMSTPLPFVMYAVWGHFFGFETQTLRIFSIILACLTYISLYHLLLSVFNNAKIALLTTAFVALNPYMLAFSIFVFTDMAAMLFLIICCIAVKDQNPILFAVSSAAGLLSRQYFAFLTVAAGEYYLIRLQHAERTKAILMQISALISFLPLLALFWIWQGPNPDNSVKRLYEDELFRFHPNSLTLYIVMIFIYLLPLVLLKWNSFFTGFKSVMIAFAASWLYWWAPVSPSKASVEIDVDTVGVFHRALRSVLGSQLEQLIFFLSFFLGLIIVLSLTRDTFTRMIYKDYGFALFLGLSILSFFVIMPFSYLGWEKYFLPAVPITAMWIQLSARRASIDKSQLHSSD